MKNPLIVIILFFFPFLCFAQSSDRMDLIGTWNSNSISCISNICYNEVWGYVDGVGKEYAILGSPEQLSFIDVSNPTNPVLKQEFIGTGRSIWRDMKSYQNFIYSVHDNNNTSDDEGLWIFDMSALPNGNVIDLGFFETDFGRAHNIFIDEPNARLYIAGSNTQGAGLIVYSLANPANPSLIANVSLATGMGGYVHDLFVRDNIAYCNSGSGSDGGMFAINMTIPTMPQYLADVETGGYNHSSWMTDDNNYVVYATETSNVPLYLVDVTDVNNGNIINVSTMKEPLLAPEHTNNIAHNPLIKGDYCYVSYYEDGIQVWDISDPENPFLEAYYDMIANTNYNGTTGVWGVYPFLPSGHILASDVNTGLYILKMNHGCANGIQDGDEIGIDCGGTFCESCPCEMPSNVIHNIGNDPNRISLNWDAVNNASFYQIRYRRVLTTSWSFLSTTSLSRIIQVLEQNKLYDYRVRAQCNSGEWSDLTPIEKFRTAQCIAPTNFNTTQLNNNKVRLEWDDYTYADKYQIFFREEGSTGDWNKMVT